MSMFRISFMLSRLHFLFYFVLTVFLSCLTLTSLFCVHTCLVLLALIVCTCCPSPCVSIYSLRFPLSCSVTFAVSVVAESFPGLENCATVVFSSIRLFDPPWERFWFLEHFSSLQRDFCLHFCCWVMSCDEAAFTIFNPCDINVGNLIGQLNRIQFVLSSCYK